ncbi:50S ribosome-binding GTPase [Candidatus Woesearchaeota archaeon]|nr:50S ribosome-binding GTPase [Candidatus Woesearchaeota archaeon]
MPQQYNIKDVKHHESAYDRKVKELEEQLSTTKYNKKTQHHIGLVKAQLARLKEEYQKKAASKGKGEGFSVKRTGDATAIIVGFPSVGKSTLLNAITNADSPVGAYAFTTLTCIPGLMEYNHSKIQILDVPGIVEGAATGRGRGKEVLACAQSADLVIILLDVFHTEHFEVVKKEIYETGLRTNQKPPLVRISKKARGGIDIGATVK